MIDRGSRYRPKSIGSHWTPRMIGSLRKLGVEATPGVWITLEISWLPPGFLCIVPMVCKETGLSVFFSKRDCASTTTSSSLVVLASCTSDRWPKSGHLDFIYGARCGNNISVGWPGQAQDPQWYSGHQNLLCCPLRSSPLIAAMGVIHC